VYRPTSIFRVHQVDLRAVGLLEFIPHAVQSRQIVSQQIFLGKSHQHQLRSIGDVSTDIHVVRQYNTFNVDDFQNFQNNIIFQSTILCSQA